jgi:hypothetical protein
VITSDTIQFVQFLHPGGERPSTSTGWKIADMRPHRRTFVTQPGRCVRDVGAAPKRTDLHFWCEWECEVDVVSEFTPPQDSDAPHTLFRPRIYPRKSYSDVANTDPCVFGDCFRYCVCQQPSKPSLKRLARGSIIVFGSHKGGAFVLDTVFVTAKKIPYRRNEFHLLKVPVAYRLAALEPLAEGCGRGEEFCLYKGATHEESVDSMFSFFPCLPAERPNGFARPPIRLDGLISPKLSQGIKLSSMTSADAVDIWREIVAQVTERSLCLGVSASLPRLGQSA